MSFQWCVLKSVLNLTIDWEKMIKDDRAEQAFFRRSLKMTPLLRSSSTQKAILELSRIHWGKAERSFLARPDNRHVSS